MGNHLGRKGLILKPTQQGSDKTRECCVPWRIISHEHRKKKWVSRLQGLTRVQDPTTEGTTSQYKQTLDWARTYFTFTDFTYFVPHGSLHVPLPELPQAPHPWGEGRGKCWTSLPQKPYWVWNFQPQHPKESWEVKTTNPVDELFVANRIKYFHKPLQCWVGITHFRKHQHQHHNKLLYI